MIFTSLLADTWHALLRRLNLQTTTSSARAAQRKSSSVTRTVSSTRSLSPSLSSTRAALPSQSQTPSQTPTPSNTRTPKNTPSGTGTPKSTATTPGIGIDWVAAGRVEAVKNQGSCGSCYAFSANAAIVSAVAIKAGAAPVTLSEQQVVDCSRPQGNAGCGGGWMANVYNYALSAGGLCSDVAYPYTGLDTAACGKAACTAVAKITSYTNLPANSRAAVESALLARPLAVAITASASSFQLYSSGVYADTRCADSAGGSVNHAVLLVAYGTTASGVPFYTLQNSWGAGWGNAGRIMFARGTTYDPAGICLVQQYPSYVTAA